MLAPPRRALAAGLVLLAGRAAVAQVDLDQQKAFADELAALLYENDNECSSALGVSMAWSLLWPGTEGDAVDEIRDALGYPGGNNMKLVWEDASAQLVGEYDGRCLDEWNGECNSAAPLLKIANSVWFDNSSALNEDYDEVVGEYAKQIDFTSPNSPVIVNEWVENSTEGLIDSIVDKTKPLYPPYVLIAINSIYLKARWQNQFAKYLTNLDNFYTSASAAASMDAAEASDAHFMHAVDYFGYSHDLWPGYQVIQLPFAESALSMIFVLPMGDDSDAVLSADLLPDASNLDLTRVALALPKYMFESEYDDNLKAALNRTGIVSPFVEGTGALCGIFEDDEGCEKLIIDKFIQKTFIDVNEEGVEAAAVTAAMAVPTSAEPIDTNVPILMVLDHPFQFFIYDQGEDVVLFEGKVGAPEVPDAEPDVALLEAKHADDEFWTARFGVNPVEPPSMEDTASTTTSATTSVANSATNSSESASTQPAVDTTTNSTSSSGASAEPSLLVPPPIDPMEHQKFADDLTALLYENDNECSSALGVSMAFSLIWPGATNNGTDQIRDTLGYPNGSNMRLVWEEATERMTSSYAGQCINEWDGVCNAAAPLLEIAYSVWFHDEEDLQEEYEKVVDDYAIQIDFEDEESPAIVNEWVSESTNGLIDTIVPEGQPLFPPYLLLAINSIYLKARWAEQFQASNTNLDSFYASPDRNVDAVVSQAHFMNMVEYQSYSHDAIPGYQILDLPFAASEMSMIVVLPMSDESEAVQSTALIPALDSLQRTRVALSLPKFTFESKYEAKLEQSLFDLGIQAPFTEGAEALCGIFDDEDMCPLLVVSKVIQKTFIDVNEEGVEAAAVTMVGVGLTAAMPETDAPVLMQLNHPFQFFIHDKSEDLVLFEGRLGAPEVPADEPEVLLLDAKHSDADFWSSRFGVDPVEPTVGTTGTTSTVSTSTSKVENLPSETAAPTPNPTPQPIAPSGSSTTTPPTKAPVSPLPPGASTGPDGTSSANAVSAKMMKCVFWLSALVYVW